MKRICTILLLSILTIYTTQYLNAQNNNKTYTLYEVKAKDTVYSIAKKNGVTPQEIYNLNPGSEAGIRIGETIKIPTSTPDNASKSQTYHIVQPGETLFAISRKYNIAPSLLKQYNPDVDPDVLKPGMKVRIALNDGTPINSENNKIIVSTSENNEVNVALLLPITAESQANRYVRFYEGFLLGMYQLKKVGVSINLSVYSTANISALKKLLSSGELVTKNLIIGGQSDAEVTLLANYTGERGITYVSPFISNDEVTGKYSGNTYRLNTPQADLYPYLCSAFLSRYKKYKTLFVTTNNANHTDVVKALKTQLKNHQLPYSEVTLDKLHNYAFNGESYVIVPDDSREATLTTLLSQLEQNHSQGIRTIFGYPEWQSYNQQLITGIGKFNTTIYTSFFFDAKMKECQTFKDNYKGWFSRSLDTTFPKYSLLGYDTARYFIRALASYGPAFSNSLSQLPSDGLQNDFIFRHIGSDKSFSSINLFFVTYTAQGKAIKYKVTF